MEHILGGTTTGSSTLSTPSIVLSIALNGHVEGESILSDNTFVEPSLNPVNGSSTLSTPFPGLTLNLSGNVTGESILALFEAIPVYGLSDLAAMLDVYREPKPGITPCVCPSPKSFRWYHLFQRGDITLVLMNQGQPFGPFEVLFTLYQVLPDDVLHQVGPANRLPVTQAPGEYYITGSAGELGQPGLWEIQWYYRVSFNDPQVMTSYRFLVEDAIAKPVSGDHLCRHYKIGWS